MGDAAFNPASYPSDCHIGGLMMKFDCAYFSNLGALEIAGVIGFFFYIGSFGAVQFGLLNGNSAAYSVLNILAATLVALSLLAEFNLSSALIQTSWIAIGLVGLALRVVRTVKRSRDHSLHFQTGDK
jgi:hypothetical protein